MSKPDNLLARKGYTWIGPNPYVWGGYALGTEDGELILTEPNGELFLQGLAAPSREAINGLAFHGNHIVATSRAEVSLIEVDERAHADVRTLSVGAHGVAVTRDGLFFAAAGRRGLLAGSWDENGPTPLTYSRGLTNKGYCYRVAALDGPDNAQAVLLANRHRGLSVMRVFGPVAQPRVTNYGYAGLDLIDVCQLGPASFAAAALDRNSTIVFVKDILQPGMTRTSKPANRFGTPYRLLAHDGHLIVLFSKGMLFLDGQAEYARAHGRLADRLTSRFWEAEVVDVNTLGPGWLGVVLADGGIRTINTARLLGPGSEAKGVAGRGQPTLSSDTDAGFVAGVTSGTMTDDEPAETAGASLTPAAQ